MSKPKKSDIEVNLTALCQKWQKILRMQDWQIEVEFVEPMLIGGSLGETHSSLTTKSAKIFVARPDMAYTRSFAFEDVARDVENTVVHELLHVMLTPVVAGIEHAEEHAVIAIADVLHKGIEWVKPDDNKLKR